MNNLIFFFFFIFILGFSSQRVLSEIRANYPPKGWNSYDSFSWTISEDEFLQNAQLVSEKLQPYGYEYVVVDYLWYRMLVQGANSDSLGFDVIDEWGRMIPDPGRWPSSTGGKGFSEVAKKVHDMGLKFGFHVMRGISTQAFNRNTLILDITTGKAYEESGKVWHAQDIGIKESVCGWMKNGFMSVNTTLGAGRAFLSSLYHQYAEWGVDLVKHDCVFGEDLQLNEITVVSEILAALDRSIIYSISPGTSATPAMAKQVAPLVNMYRVTADDWDNWGDVAAHFDVSRDFAAASMVGAKGLLGSSWPDLDMVPLGWLTDPGVNEGPHRMSQLTLDEQRTQMTLWSMARSPLMFGGDMRKLDDATCQLITHPILLEIHSFSSDNREVTTKEKNETSLSPCVPDAYQIWELSSNGTLVNSYSDSCASIKVMKDDAGPGRIRVWTATGRRGEAYLGVFNLYPTRAYLTITVSNISKVFPKINFSTCLYKDVWSDKEYKPLVEAVVPIIDTHGCALFIFDCN